MYQQGKIKTQIRKTETNIKFQKPNGLSLKLVLENPKNSHSFHSSTHKFKHPNNYPNQNYKAKQERTKISTSEAKKTR